MNTKALNFIKSFSYTLSSNLVSLVISTLVTLIIPKIIGIEDYGYWQLYMLYVSYVGVFHLGWDDGIYLRYGGENYGDLDKKKFFSQFITLFLSQLFFAVTIILLVYITIDEQDRIFIINMFALNVVIVNIRFFFLYILQATNRIREYAIANILDRLSFLILILSLLALGSKDYRLMIISDIIGKTISILYLMWLCREITFNKITDYYLDLKEIILNISAGSKLLLANMASNLIVGIVRFGIEKSWDVATFGKVSLTLSISNFMLIFINGVAIVVYPVFRRTNFTKLKSIYRPVRDFATVISFAILLFYYPFRVILSSWLPQYSESLKYMALLFPMVVYEGKISLLINTYLKTLRKEKVMLNINLISLIFSFIMTIFTTIVFKNLNAAVLTILLVQMFRVICSEIYLSKQLQINLKKDIILELIMTISFILSSWFISSWLTVIIYGLVFILYLSVKRLDLRNTKKVLFALLIK